MREPSPSTREPSPSASSLKVDVLGPAERPTDILDPHLEMRLVGVIRLLNVYKLIREPAVVQLAFAAPLAIESTAT
jgi:hypothetical protein